MELNNQKVKTKISPKQMMDAFLNSLIEEGLLTTQQILEVGEASEGLTIWESMVASGLVAEEDYARLISKCFNFKYVVDVKDENLSEVIFETREPISKEDLIAFFKIKMFVPIIVNGEMLFLIQHHNNGYKVMIEQQIINFAVASAETILKTIQMYEEKFLQKE